MLVIDNGAYTIKISDGERNFIIPNCVTRSKDNRQIFIADQSHEQTLLTTLQYRRPHEKGYLTNWETEKAIWDFIFKDKFPDIKFANELLLLTEAPNNFSTLQANCDEMVFEEYKFESYIRCTPASLIPWSTLGHLRSPGDAACMEVVLVVDSGYSFTHITPVINGVPVHQSTKRLNVGGKFLTNALKETVSFRQYNMMEETQLMNQIKEECCFVTDDFARDMERARKGELSKTFVLPDFSRNVPGHVADESTMMDDEMQILTLKYELFAVPELLFRPSDIGSSQCGIVEGVMESIKDLDEPIRALCLDNIVLIGGNTKLPGFAQRFEKDLRALAPDEFELGIYAPEDPIMYTCQAGCKMTKQTSHVQATQVTRAEYQETNKKAALKFNQSLGTTSTGRNTPEETPVRRRESKYEETSDRADTPRSFSPDTEPEDVQEEADTTEMET